ncbi:hypothetical protein HDU86_007565 [Geranomyces michiganensis]|nr:hypothetical protein HDU86_007565 [Geranomyces michiganensis]
MVVLLESILEVVMKFYVERPFMIRRFNSTSSLFTKFHSVNWLRLVMNPYVEIAWTLYLKNSGESITRLVFKLAMSLGDTILLRCILSQGIDLTADWVEGFLTELMSYEIEQSDDDARSRSFGVLMADCDTKYNRHIKSIHERLTSDVDDLTVSMLGLYLQQYSDVRSRIYEPCTPHQPEEAEEWMEDLMMDTYLDLLKTTSLDPSLRTLVRTMYHKQLFDELWCPVETINLILDSGLGCKASDCIECIILILKGMDDETYRVECRECATSKDTLIAVYRKADYVPRYYNTMQYNLKTKI